ncbi:hypothetical protein [uncultured Ruminococcus sp.]|uniref:hypothetical protein n=1 Tax=uncultured Ruminococcus sp. TaxID=165186 RepID=UPI0025E72E55|nr:hypothetical protein [uncultured Ruminococcus sp.]
MDENVNMSAQQMYDQYGRPLPKKPMSAVKAVILVVCGIVAFALYVHYGRSFGTFRGTSYKEFVKRARARSYSDGIPDGAEDFRFICHNYAVGGSSWEAFTLHGAAYDEFVEEVNNKTPGKVVGYHEDLDFTGMKVSETADMHDDSGEYIGFPVDSLKYVIDDDINDYTILYYDSYEGAGASTSAIAAYPETGRIVIYSYACR